MSDRQDFARIIGRLFLAFHVEATVALISVYWEALKDLPMPGIQSAVAKIIQNKADGYRPVPGQIRKEVFGDIQPRAMIAWQQLNQAIMSVGAYRDPTFDDPAIGAIVQQHGGWIRICGMPSDEFDNWFRKYFFADYETIRSHAGELKQLSGLTTLANKRIEHESRIEKEVNRLRVRA